MIEIGFKINGMEVIAKAEMLKTPRKRGKGKFNNRPQVLVKCFCGGIKVVRWDSFKKGELKSCGCIAHPGNKLGKFTRRYGPDSQHWKGCGEIGKFLWNHICDQAKIRDLKVEVTIEDIWDLFLKQNKLCALTGEPLKFGITVKNHRAGLTTASLDRIDSNKGYTLDNIQWVHKTVNLLKMQLAEKDFIEWCQKVVNWANKGKSNVSLLDDSKSGCGG